MRAKVAYLISFFPYVPQKLLKDWYKLMKVRSSRPEVFCKKVFLEILPNYLCQNLFFNKVAGLKQLKLSAIFVEHIWEETSEINHFQFSVTGVFLWILWNFWEHLRRLLLESDDIVEHLPEKIEILKLMSPSLFPDCFDQYFLKKYTAWERINIINLIDISLVYQYRTKHWHNLVKPVIGTGSLSWSHKWIPDI